MSSDCRLWAEHSQSMSDKLRLAFKLSGQVQTFTIILVNAMICDESLSGFLFPVAIFQLLYRK